MSENGTYYHPRLDLSPTALLRWAKALTEYPQSWTCLNVRHVDSLRQRESFFSPQTPLMQTRVRSMRVTPTQTLAETPYCLNKWASWAFICPNIWGGLDVLYYFNMLETQRPSFIRQRGRLKTCQTSSRLNLNVDLEWSRDSHHLRAGFC